ncbi:MAG: hypothetical protein ACTSQL_02020 [Promethearchaeota archaeon]
MFLTGVDFNYFPERVFTTPGIINELKVQKYIDRNRNILLRIEIAIETGKLVVKKCQDMYSHKVEEKSISTGTTKVLSKNDINLIGLVLELMDTYSEDIILYTNDYSMENLCTLLKIRFKPLYKKGIEEKMYFEVYCPYCKTLHKPEDLGKKCERCGLHLKKRLLKKEKL